MALPRKALVDLRRHCQIAARLFDRAAVRRASARTDRPSETVPTLRRRCHARAVIELIDGLLHQRRACAESPLSKVFRLRRCAPQRRSRSRIAAQNGQARRPRLAHHGQAPAVSRSRQRAHECEVASAPLLNSQGQLVHTWRAWRRRRSESEKLLRLGHDTRDSDSTVSDNRTTPPPPLAQIRCRPATKQAEPRLGHTSSRDMRRVLGRRPQAAARGQAHEATSRTSHLRGRLQPGRPPAADRSRGPRKEKILRRAVRRERARREASDPSCAWALVNSTLARRGPPGIRAHRHRRRPAPNRSVTGTGPSAQSATAIGSSDHGRQGETHSPK